MIPRYRVRLAVGVLQDAIQAHERWNALLADEIRGGGEGLHAETVRKDDQCPLGRWLYGSGRDAVGDPAAWELIRDIHARFHLDAVTVLLLARTGRRSEAVQAMEEGAPFGKWSATLLAALRDFLD